MDMTPKDPRITIDDDYYSINKNTGRMICFRCDHIIHYFPPPYGTYGTGEPMRCGGDSAYIVSYPIASGKIITKHICEQHIKEYTK